MVFKINKLQVTDIKLIPVTSQKQSILLSIFENEQSDLAILYGIVYLLHALKC